MKNGLAAVALTCTLFSAFTSLATELENRVLKSLKTGIEKEFTGRTPHQWGERVKGVKTELATKEPVLVLTLDACGSSRGKGFDSALISYLKKLGIPATLFINAQWIDANMETFLSLASNPLFEIANHGTRHKPASINGQTIYGIKGTASPGELVDEIETNSLKILGLTGHKPKHYRSGTAFYDEAAVELANRMGYEVVGYNVLGDAGATFTADQVKKAMLSSRPGSIILLHMNHPEGGTAAGVIAAIPELQKQGFKFAKLSDFRLR